MNLPKFLVLALAVLLIMPCLGNVSHLHGNSQEPEATEPSQQVSTDDGVSQELDNPMNPPRFTSDDMKSRYFNIIKNRFEHIRFDHPRPVKADACDLSIEIFPYYFEPIVRKGTFRLIFSSNCMERMDINFEIDFENYRDINWFFHPQNIYLNLWNDNVYRLYFEAPVVIDRYDVMKSLQYRRVTLFNMLNGQRRVDLRFQNNIFLNPQQNNSFNVFNVQKIVNTKAFVKCNVRERKMKNWNQMAAKRELLIRSMRNASMNAEELEEFVKMRLKNDIDTNAAPRVPAHTFAQMEKADVGAKPSKGTFENEEEKYRLENREKVLDRLRFEFIDDIDAECIIA